MPEITLIPGDGIGREVLPMTVELLESLDLDLTFFEAEAGDRVKEETGIALPAETLNLVDRSDATLFGAVGQTAAETILTLRQAIDSFVNIRPVCAYPGVNAIRSETELVILRENSEGVYAGRENEVADGVTTLTRVITEDASRRIAEFGFEYANNNDYSNVTIAHKENVMQLTDGLFLDTVERVGEEMGQGYETQLMDALAMHVILHPEEYGVIITPNLAGDMLSDLAAGLVGGLGLLPSANIGPERGLFEPVHGSAPDIAGDGVANPVAMILSAVLMLEYLGYDETGMIIRDAVRTVLGAGPRTPDIGGDASTRDVADAVLEAIERQ